MRMRKVSCFAGTIDAAALDGLHLATELTNHISVKADTEEETGEDFAKFFPSLVWCVRDHHLELLKDGRPISANEYLENCLALKNSKKREVMEYNILRQTIRAFFQKRHCFVFPPPTDHSRLNELDQMKLEDLGKI